MLERVADDNIQDYLTALADGELDAAQILSVLDYLDAHPQALTLMRRQQRVRLAAAHAIRTLTPPVPDSLRRMIEASSVSTPVASGAAAPKTAAPRFRKWTPMFLAAAMLFVGLIVGRLSDVTTSPPKPQTVSVDQPVPVNLIAYASRTHADCSRLAEGLHSADYPRALAGLAGAVQADMAGSASHPDLTGIGYKFVGAGPCADPLRGTVHLLYHRIGAAGPRRAISVFVQANTGQFNLQRGKLYLLSGPRSPYPMYAWRTDAVVYFLIADNEATATSAMQQIAIAPRS